MKKKRAKFKANSAPAAPPTPTPSTPAPARASPLSYLAREFGMWAAAAGLFAAANGAYVISNRVYPTPEKFLQRNGLNPALVRQVTDASEDIRVRDTAQEGAYLHSYFDNMISPGYKPSRTVSNTIQSRILTGVFRSQVVNLPDPSRTLKDEITETFGFSPNMIERDPISARDSMLARALHEFAHTSKKNRSLKTMDEKEIAADEDMLRAVRPEIRTAFMNVRALDPMSGDHNDILALAHALGGAPAVSIAQMQAATTEFENARRALRLNFTEEKPWYANMPAETNDRIFAHFILESYALRQNPNSLSPLARERADLFLRAAEYFMPGLCARIRDYAANAGHSAPTPFMAPVR